MEPLDTDFDYVVRESRERRPVSRNTRFNLLFIFPALGVLWLLYLLGAAVFQWPVSGVVDSVMTLMIVVFVAVIALMFWALAPGAKGR